MAAVGTSAAAAKAYAPSGPWTDLALTLPIFVLYHVGVVFLPVRNAADRVTETLVALASDDRLAYVALTLGLGALYVAVLLLLGRRQSLAWENFVWLACEGIVYAVTMRLVASYVVGGLLFAAGAGPLAALAERYTGLVMSLGAGLYEELVFRVILFGWGLWLLRRLAGPLGRFQRGLLAAVWALVAALVFSAWHHFGVLGDPIQLGVFAFRTVCGLVFTLIYALRGFAPVVWTHVVYDLWVLVV
jgi:membrane protease YdiL (CAAX protease family)